MILNITVYYSGRYRLQSTKGKAHRAKSKEDEQELL